MTAKREKDQKQQDARITITEEELRTNTGIQLRNRQKSTVINFFSNSYKLFTFLINKY